MYIFDLRKKSQISLTPINMSERRNVANNLNNLGLSKYYENQPTINRRNRERRNEKRRLIDRRQNESFKLINPNESYLTIEEIRLLEDIYWGDFL